MTKILILIDNFILEARSDLIYSTAQLVTTETDRTNKKVYNSSTYILRLRLELLEYKLHPSCSRLDWLAKHPRSGVLKLFSIATL
jgi:hypothetical protein